MQINQEKRPKKQEKKQKEIESLLEKYSNKIVEVQTREFISVSEATVMFGISKDTIHRMIKKGLIGGANLGIRLTRVKRADLENLFSTIEMPIEKKKEEKPTFEIGNCYTLSEVSEKYSANPSTVSSAIRKNNIPKKKVGSFVYVPKKLIDEIFDGK